MSQQGATPSGTPSNSPGSPWPPRQSTGGRGGWVTGGVTFAGVLMLCGGVLAVLQGIAAVAEDDVYRRVGSYVYEFDLTGWGVIHIVLGVLVAVTGWGLLSGRSWARVAGIVLASLGLVLQFLFLPYQPFWAVVMMAIDLFVIWSLVSAGVASADSDR
ncbi:hypothetical protein ABZZ79_09075 [Streptomyces sp. NPDC006458]|uniref:DUF7144 family membrane protein n=1 Tax=Streptomyces sp. NPDC006458 TaxID=3154302 RepID=UPI00339F347E